MRKEERHNRQAARDPQEVEKTAGPPHAAGASLPGKPPFIGGIAQGPAPGTDEQDQKVEEAPPKKNTRTIETSKGNIEIENYCPADKLDKLNVDEGIRMFSRHNPERQKQALVKVARLAGGNIVTGIHDGMLVSYIGLHHPSERERWGKPGYQWLYELGAIEVSRAYRQSGLAEDMLDVAFDDPFYDDKIILTTAFTWHWDLEGTGMNKMQYRELFLHLATKYGFIEMGTDEPNITMDPMNLFLVRLGSKASFLRYQRFSSLLYVSEWEAMLRGF